MTVIAAGAGHVQLSRGDAAQSELCWMRVAHARKLHVRGVEFRVSNQSEFSGYDGIIAPIQGSSIDSTLVLARRSLSRNLRVGLWGHAAQYVNEPNWLDAAIEKLQMRVCDHVFTYTPGGAKYAANVGVHRARITAVENSVDVSDMLSELQLFEPQRSKIREKYGLVEGKTLTYIGGLDRAKRIDFLCSVLDELFTRDPQYRVLVGGAGMDRGLLEAAERRGQVIVFGHVRAGEKAMLFGLADALLMPGRIGLVAVEALATGTPILSTTWPYHAPEREYLVEGESLHTSYGDDVLSYVALILSRRYLVQSPRWPYPTLDKMVQNFVRGIATMYGMDV